jgi:type II secretory ATPase GspE/PulE/Tfp pilus assembly ATPase PilB-like protein
MEKSIKSLQKKGVSLPETIQGFVGKGCDQCSHTSYQGRIAIAEVLPMTEPIRKAILLQQTEDEILEKAETKGFITMKEDGIRKILEGKTTIEEVWKVLL